VNKIYDEFFKIIQELEFGGKNKKEKA
jgi:hypothetical protein